MNSHIGRDRNQNSKTGVRSRMRVGLAMGVLTLIVGHLYAAPGVLSQTPLFLATGVQPNIFFMLDDSGSMNRERIWRYKDEPAGLNFLLLDFTPDNVNESGGSLLQEQQDLCPVYNTLAYDPSQTYTPWFGVDMNGKPYTDVDPNKAPVNPYTGTAQGSANCDDNGIVNNSNGVTCDLINGFVVDADKTKGLYGAYYYEWTDTNKNGEYDQGECDLAHPQYVRNLTAAGQTNYANWFSYYRKRQYILKRAMSQIVQEATQRVGMGTINNRSHLISRNDIGTPVKDVDDLSVPLNVTAQANKTKLLDNLFGINPGSATSLRRALQRVGEYFAGNDSTALFGRNTNLPADPNSAKVFSPILKAELGGTCQQNFAVVMSDGFWNGVKRGGPPSKAILNADGDSAIDTSIYDEQSYGDVLPGNGYPTLADIAMHYYEGDLIDGLANKVPIVDIDAAPDQEYARDDAATCSDTKALTENPAGYPECFDTNTAQHLVTYTVAFGMNGTIPKIDTSTGKTCVPYSRGKPLSEQNWPTNCDTSLKLSTGWPTPIDDDATTIDDMLHAAWNGRGLFLSAKDSKTLIGSLRQIMQNIESKEAVAAAAVAVDSSSIIGGGNVVQGKFSTTGWSGELNSYAVTIDDKGKINLTLDWSAQHLLDERGYLTRNAVTFNGTSGIPFAFPSDYQKLVAASDISKKQLDDLMFNAPYPADTAVQAEIDANKAYGENLVAYLRGDSSMEGKGFRPRSHKLGDIIHSAPVYVGDPDPSRYSEPSYQAWANYGPSDATPGAKGRQAMIYVGANDGALHAFYADGVNAGQEAFAYFPQAVFNSDTQWGLHFLADPGYIHRYYVDGDITVAEVYADLHNTGTKKWSTVLVGMLRGGGRAVYAIDISDPSTFATASGVARNILWEFSNDELGFTYGKATIAKLNNGRWAAIFGNGYLPGSAASGKAALFIKYLEKYDSNTPVADVYRLVQTGKGSNVDKDCLSSGSACNGLSTPAVVDLGGDNVADRAYAGDLMGNLWAFDLSSASEAAWLPANGAASPLFTATSDNATNPAQQITAQPAVIMHPTERHSNTSPNTMIYFGTGQYVTETDPISTTNNSFYGIWDSGSVVDQGRGGLVEQTITTTKLGTEDIRIMSNNPVDYSTARGWYVDFVEKGERVVANAIAFGDVVVYNTIVPQAAESTDLCASSDGASWLMVQSLIDGSEPDFIALDVTGEGTFDENDQKGDQNVSGVRSGTLGWQVTISKSGAGAEGVAFIPAKDLDTRRIRGGRSVGTRASWGRFIIE